MVTCTSIGETVRCYTSLIYAALDTEYTFMEAAHDRVFVVNLGGNRGSRSF